jgi:hypothetical protein
MNQAAAGRVALLSKAEVGEGERSRPATRSGVSGRERKKGYRSP